MKGKVIAINISEKKGEQKHAVKQGVFIEDFGLEGDAHAGKKVKHRFLVGIDPTKPNIRQVHLIHVELLEELNRKGFTVHPGELGENITTRGIDLLGLPTGTRLLIGADVKIEITALRNPCVQIDWFQKGLLKEVLYKNEDGKVVRRAGVMGIILAGGQINPNDEIFVELPLKPRHPLEYIW